MKNLAYISLIVFLSGCVKNPIAHKEPEINPIWRKAIRELNDTLRKCDSLGIKYKNPIYIGSSERI